MKHRGWKSKRNIDGSKPWTRRPQSNREHNTCTFEVMHASPHLGHDIFGRSSSI